MKKPVINLSELSYQSFEHGKFSQRYADISPLICAQRLGYNLTIISPGKVSVPHHNHHNNEELFFILEGEGVLRFGDQEFPLKKDDVVACPPGGRSVAHQITNTGTQDLKYLAISTLERTDVVEYPDSDKILVVAGDPEKRDVRKIFKAQNTVEYFDGE